MQISNCSHMQSSDRLQVDRTALLGGAVDGEDEIDGLPALVDVDGRTGAGFDRADHIRKLPRVAVERDGRRRGGRAEGGGLDDDAAFGGDPAEVYGKLVDMGATMIQTDRPELLISYLRSRGLHN